MWVITRVEFIRSWGFGRSLICHTFRWVIDDGSLLVKISLCNIRYSIFALLILRYSVKLLTILGIFFVLASRSTFPQDQGRRTHRINPIVLGCDNHIAVPHFFDQNHHKDDHEAHPTITLVFTATSNMVRTYSRWRNGD